MLKTLQIIVILQGIFLLFTLFHKKKQLIPVNFWLLFFTIVSVLLYAVGDDNFNLIAPGYSWYVFYDPLLITAFFFLFYYRIHNKLKFDKKDLIYTIPYFIFVIGQPILDAFETSESEINSVPLIALVSSILIGYLLYIIIKVIQLKKDLWVLCFILPYTIIYSIDRCLFFITGDHDSLPFLETYGTIGLSAFLFYVMLFKLIIAPDSIIAKPELTKYKTSTLKDTNIEKYITELTRLMEVEKLFKNDTLTVNSTANIIGIPRQHLSEILNIHMKISFQDYINQYRVNEFIKLLQHPNYKKYTLLGIANEVGFKSKSSFNTTFKKITGLTPSAYKKQLQENN